MTLLNTINVGGTDFKVAGVAVLGSCPTPAGSEVKVCTFADDFELEAGDMLLVKFTYANTYGDGSTTYPKLQVNGTNYAMRHADGSYIATGEWDNNATLTFLFDGTDFILPAGSLLLNTVDVVEEGNLHAVTSNAVAEAMSYSTSEVATGKKWIDGKPIYRKSGYVSSISSVPYIVDSVLTDTYVDVLIESKASMKYYSSKVVVYGYTSATDRFSLNATSSGLELATNFSLADIVNGFYWTVEYTKTTPST